jgi:hypothetical protein
LPDQKGMVTLRRTVAGGQFAGQILCLINFVQRFQDAGGGDGGGAAL